ncbi:hypothetical protein ACQCN2_02315 [Brevibacillus ginsengisoli]|uniref:hypothetical protein n=1 Tax=Brevibacillus ginsengisoli TaxID=363854 RepID=UPI003CE7DB21
MTINRQTVLLVIMFLFLLGGGFYYFFTIPLHKETDQLEQTLAQEKTLLTKLQEATTVKEEKKNVAFPSDYQASIPEAPYLEQVMLDMTRLETISGVEMEGIGLSDQDQDNQTGGNSATSAKEISFPPIGETKSEQAPFIGVKGVSISTKIKGSYEQVHRFFTELSSLPRLMRVESAKLSGGNGNFIFFNPPNDENKQISVEVTIAAYYVPALKSFFKHELPIIVPSPDNRTNPFY